MYKSVTKDAPRVPETRFLLYKLGKKERRVRDSRDWNLRGKGLCDSMELGWGNMLIADSMLGRPVFSGPVGRYVLGTTPSKS